MIRLLLGSAFFLAAAAAADPWRVCAEKAAAQPKSWEISCFYRLARSTFEVERAEHALQARRPAKDDDPYLLFQLGRLKLDRGLFQEAGVFFERSATLFAAEDERLGLVYALTNLADCREQDPAGENSPDELAGLFAKARAAAASLPDPAHALHVDIKEARALISAGRDLARADALLKAIDSAAVERSAASLQSTFWSTRGLLAYHLGRTVAALDAYERMAGVNEKAGDLFGLGRARYAKAMAHTNLPPTLDHRLALERATAALLDVAERGRDPQLEARALLLKGKLRGSSGQADLRRAVAISRRLEDLQLRSEALFALAVVVDEDESLRLLAEADALLEGAGAPYVGLFGSNDRLSAIFMHRPRSAAIAEALLTLERIESLRRQQHRGLLRAELFGVWREVYDWLIGRLLESHDRAERALAFELLERARARDLLESSAAQAARPMPIAPLAEVEAALSPNQALLSFFVVDEVDIYGGNARPAAVFVTRSTGTEVLPLLSRRELDALTSLWRGALENRDERGEERLAAAGFRRLFAPLERTLEGVDELLISADFALHHLPWAALLDHQGRRLVERFRIGLIPSATWWTERQKDRLLPRPAWVLADPAFDSHREQAPRLEGARREGQAVVERLGGRLFVGAEARAKVLKGRLDDFGVIHLAAHTLVDFSLPQRSAFLLAAEPGSSGRVTLEELNLQPLSGQIVVLAACSSADGFFLAGEGLASPSRFFLEKGAGAVLASAWPLADQESKDFFDHFYRRLARGERLAAALANTQKDLVDRHQPAAWAGFVFQGDPDLRLEPQPPRKDWLWLVGLGILVLGGLGLATRGLHSKFH